MLDDKVNTIYIPAPLSFRELRPFVHEINAINSSGFYACDMGKYVDAINALA